MKISKSDVRQRILSDRNLLSVDERKTLSAQICDMIRHQIHVQYGSGARILFFAPMEYEVDVMMLFQAFSQTEEISCFFPKITNQEAGVFEAFPVTSAEQLEVSHEHFGVREPVSGTSIDPKSLDIVFVPAVAVDTSGNRIGYGGGYYDRFLKKLRPDCQKWAIVFSCQRVEKIAPECHDVGVDAIVDENGFDKVKD